jgi:hypothetical protein
MLPRLLRRLAHDAMVAGAGLTLRTGWRQSRHERVRLGTPGACSRGQQRSTSVSYGPLGLAAHLRERCHPGPGRALSLACKGQGVQIPSAPPGITHRQVARSGSLARDLPESHFPRPADTLSAGRFGGFEAFHDESCREDFLLRVNAGHRAPASPSHQGGPKGITVAAEAACRERARNRERAGNRERATEQRVADRIGDRGW